MSSRTNRRLPLLAAASILVVSGCPGSDIGDGDALSRVSVRVSVKQFGQESNGVSGGGAISPDGRYLAFHSTASDLTPNDSNGLQDVFVKDRLTGDVDNVSIVDTTPLFGPSEDDARDPAISADGRYVAFLSEADLIPVYTAPASLYPGLWNVWVFDRVTRTMAPVTKGDGSNLWPDQPCSNVTISADGQWVSFATRATNLGYANAGGDTQVYASQWQTSNPLVLVSHATASALVANDASRSPRISADGQYVIFASDATNLASGGVDADANTDVYLGRTDGSDAELVSVNTGGTKGDGFSFNPSVSGDGQFVVFVTTSSNLAAGSSGTSVILRDRMAGTTVLVAADSWTAPLPVFPNGGPCDVSDDGQIVVFKDYDATGVASPFGQIVARHMQGGVELVSTNLRTQLPGNLEAFNPLLSRDGTWCVYSTASEDIVEDDTNGVTDIFVRGPLQ